MDVNELKEILKVLDERQIAEFELEKEGIKLRIRRAEAGHAPPSGPVASLVAPPPATAVPTAPAAAAPDTPPPAQAEEDPNVSILRSPIVGTFYRSPAPDAGPFTDVGERVSVGQVLCIIEAMKLMNEIEAETAGEVIRVHVENGTPVQYGDPLFSIRTA